MLTLAEAAASLGIEHDTLRRQIRLGKLKARKVGPIWTVSEREVERYRRENLRG
jgi:excisionase family DNA binding protein